MCPLMYVVTTHFSWFIYEKLLEECKDQEYSGCVNRGSVGSTLPSTQYSQVLLTSSCLHPKQCLESASV